MMMHFRKRLDGELLAKANEIIGKECRDERPKKTNEDSKKQEVISKENQGGSFKIVDLGRVQGSRERKSAV